MITTRILAIHVIDYNQEGEAIAGVEPEVDITTIRVYEDLPNVYRMKNILMLNNQSSFQYYFLP
jgi:hypothetical protein